MADKEFIPVPQATELTGKSTKKLLKLCEAYRDTKYVKFKNGTYTIRLDFLTKQFLLLEKAVNKGHVATEQPPKPQLGPEIAAFREVRGQPDWQTHMITVLEEQLKEKDRQLATKEAQLSQLIERNREQNNIIFSLEQHTQALESRMSLPMLHSQPSPVSEQPGKKTFISYITFGLTILLVGVALIIFYAVLIS
jgi:hypothetical protein